MILPIRSTRVPIAIDMISPLFKELSKTCKIGSLLHPEEHMDVSSSEVGRSFANSLPKRGRPRNADRKHWRETPISDNLSPTPEPEIVIKGRPGRKKGGKNKKRWPSLTPPKYNGGKLLFGAVPLSFS